MDIMRGFPARRLRPRGEMDIITGFEPVGLGPIPSEGTDYDFSFEKTKLDSLQRRTGSASRRANFALQGPSFARLR